MHEIWYVAELQTWSSLMSQLRKNFIKFAVCLKRYMLALMWEI